MLNILYRVIFKITHLILILYFIILLTKIIYHYFIILNLLYTFLFWSKKEWTYLKFGRKVNRPKIEMYGFSLKRTRPLLLVHDISNFMLSSFKLAPLV